VNVNVQDEPGVTNSEQESAVELLSRRHDWLRGACIACEGFGYIDYRMCQGCDGTGFRADRTYTLGYGWRRLLFWPWHYIQHVRRGLVNSWKSVLFCTWCVDDRMRDFYAEAQP
jgi:hypothetical protein